MGGLNMTEKTYTVTLTFTNKQVAALKRVCGCEDGECTSSIVQQLADAADHGTALLPMPDAPRDGTSVLAVSPAGRICEWYWGTYDTPCWLSDWVDEERQDCHFVGWLPLPKIKDNGNG